MKFLLATAMISLAALSAARAQSPVRSSAPSDQEAITATALDFEQGWYTADGERMARALHPGFLMRHVGVDPKTGQDVVDQDVRREELISWTKAGRGRTPPERQRHDVTVLDIFQNAATAKIIAWYGVDYLQLARWNGRWVIMSVLWARNPKDTPAR